MGEPTGDTGGGGSVGSGGSGEWSGVMGDVSGICSTHRLSASLVTRNKAGLDVAASSTTLALAPDMSQLFSRVGEDRFPFPQREGRRLTATSCIWLLVATLS